MTRATLTFMVALAALCACTKEKPASDNSAAQGLPAPDTLRPAPPSDSANSVSRAPTPGADTAKGSSVVAPTQTATPPRRDSALPNPKFKKMPIVADTAAKKP